MIMGSSKNQLALGRGQRLIEPTMSLTIYQSPSILTTAMFEAATWLIIAPEKPFIKACTRTVTKTQTNDEG